MTGDPIRAIVLAAGRSTRMKSERSKVVHTILGKAIINFQLESLVASGIGEPDITVVIAPDGHEIREAVSLAVNFAVQPEPKGTADAVLQALPVLGDLRGSCLVTVGDNPYVSAAELGHVLIRHRDTRAACTMLTALFPDDVPPYGRIIRDGKGRVTGIVEERDASPEQRRIREVNASIYLFDETKVFPLLPEIDNHNRKNEYYLTDIVSILVKKELRIETVQAGDRRVAVGINNRWDLQAAHSHFNRRRLKELALEKGVTILQPDSVTVEYGAEIGRGTTIYPCSYIASGTVIGKRCRIGPSVYLEAIHIPDDSRIIMEKRSDSQP